MSPELIGIMTLGVALAALQMASIKGLREEIRSLREDMDQRFAVMEQRIGALEQRIGALAQRLARIEGMIEGFFNRRLQVETAPTAVEPP